MVSEKNKETKVVAKKNIHTMQHSDRKHPVRNATRALKYGTIGFARNIWLTIAAILVMSITLIILFVTIVTSVVFSDTADSMREKIEYVLYFDPKMSDSAFNDAAEIMRATENVRSVEAFNSEVEYHNIVAKYENGSTLAEILQDEDFLAELRATAYGTIHVKVYDTSNYAPIKDVVDNDPLFQKYINRDKLPNYETDQKDISTIVSWSNIAKNGGLILGIVFLAISILVIFNTIRMAIFSRREEIYMMKLVGANNNFIRGPFLIEAEICGVLSGIIAGALSSIGYMLAETGLADWGIDITRFHSIFYSNQLIIVFALFILTGALIGRISARFAVSRYLRKA